MKEIDIYAYKFTENDLRAGNYDFMHGGLSAGIYFTDREAGRTLDKRLENMLTILAQNATISENGITWEDKLTKYFTQHYQPDYDITNIEYNLGLSHGMPGILVFLQRCLNRKIQVKECRRLLEGGVTWLLNHASSENEICYYGTKVISGKESSKSSRLAWCYGDLGIMTTLWQCAETLNDQKVMQHAINIGLKAAKRSFENEPPVDAGICHGTAGIAQLFNRMYQNCGEPRFKKAAIHWLEATLKLAKHHDGYAGYKKFINEGYVNEEGVLEGVAGIGLVLISALSGKLDWDRLILIS